MADVVGLDNRNVRQNTMLNNLDISELNVTNPYGQSGLLMNGVDGYKVESRNSLAGKYSKNVQPVNNDELMVKNPFKAFK